MKIKKLISQILVIAMIITLAVGFAGCGTKSTGSETSANASTAPAASNAAPSSAAPAASESPVSTTATKKTPADTFVYGLDFAGAKFDPMDSVAGWLTAIYMTYERLVSFNPKTGEVQPMLAKSWSWTDDTTVVFQLRDDVTFSDGSKLTGDDVLFSWNRLLKSMMWAAQAKNIDFENSKADGSTLTIKLLKPNAEFLANICAVGFSVVSKAYVEKNGEDFFKLNPMGTGPYKMTAFNQGESITYESNGSYWGGTPAYKNVILKLMIDEATRAASFEAGELDAARLTTIDSINTLIGREAEGINLNRVNSGFTYYINLGDINQYFKDQNLRLAFAHAIDWKALVEAIWGDNATLMQSCIPDFSPYYKSISAYEYNPDLSKEYLDKGGFKDGYIIKMAVSNSGNDQAIAEIMQSYLAAVGIKLAVTVCDNALARQYSASGEMDLSIGQGNGFNGYASNAIMGKIAGSNSILQEIHTDTDVGKQFQQYIVDLMAEQDTTKRAEIAAEIQQFVYDQCLWIPLVQVKFTVVSWNYMQGIQEELDLYGTDTGLDLRGLLLTP